MGVMGCGCVVANCEVSLNLIWNLGGKWFEVESFEVREKEES